MPGALFVNTESADHKLVNRLLLHLRDWEYGEDPTWDNFHFIRTEILPVNDDEVDTTSPPITENDLSNNIWANKSISDIQSFMLSQRENEVGLNVNTFLILDEQGVKDGTIVLLDPPYNDDDDKMEEKFNKVRLPWEKAYIMWCNLDIANMNFDDFAEEDADGDDEEWWTYTVDQEEETDEAKNVKEKRNNAILELEQKGLA